MIHQPTPIKVLRANLGLKRGAYNIFSVMRRALDPLLQPKLYPLGSFLGSRFSSSIDVAFLAVLVARYRITKYSAKTKGESKSAIDGPERRAARQKDLRAPAPSYVHPLIRLVRFHRRLRPSASRSTTRCDDYTATPSPRR